MIYAFPHFEQFTAFVKERYRIHLRRKRGKPEPWTTDPILATYRFTNVYRELDRVTKWIAEHWREPHADYKHLWFSMAVARLINLPDTLESFSLPGVWNKTQFLKVMRDRRAAGLQMYGGAYIISTQGATSDKSVFLAEKVFDPLWNARATLVPTKGQRIEQWHSLLMQFAGMGNFIAGQVLADIKYVEPLRNAKDWWTFAASGPGSRKGLNYVMGREPEAAWKEHEWREALSELRTLVRPVLEDVEMPRMHAQDLQNCLCEFSKYRRTQLGDGRPKQKFKLVTEDY
jgi:hypothetical protein